MSQSLNQVQLIGRLGQNPESRFTPNGKQVVKFSLATDRTWTNAAGERQQETDWHNIEVWGKLAEICNSYLTKGRLVFIQGRLQTDKFEKDGETKYYTKIVGSQMVMLGSNPNGNGGAAPEEPMPMGNEDEIPF